MTARDERAVVRKPTKTYKPCECGHGKSFHRSKAPHECWIGNCRCREYRAKVQP